MTLAEALKMQACIDSGMAWRLEGSVGRAAFAAIDAGYCMLGEDSHKDYWGNVVPSRFDVQPGTVGSRGYFEAKQDEIEYESWGQCEICGSDVTEAESTEVDGPMDEPVDACPGCAVIWQS